MMQMKKIAISVLLLLAAVSASAQAVYPDNEIGVTFGVGSAADTQALIKATFSAFMDETTDVKMTGTLGIEYFRQVSNLVSIGVSFGYNSATIITDGTASKSTYYSLIPSVKLNWYKRDWFGAYSRFGVGPTLRNKAGVNSLKLGYQASLLGLEVGRNFRFFAEGGFGTHGLALVGLRYRF